MIKRFSLTVLCIVLAACTAPVDQPPPQLTFANLQPIPLSVTGINVHATGSKIGGGFISDPAAVAETYLKQRFYPRGGMGTLEATIQEATVTKDEKPSDNKVAKFLNVDKTEVYNLVLSIRFEHVDAAGQLLYGKVLTARRKLNISEHDSVGAREQFEFQSLEKMFNEIDHEVVHMVTEDMHLGQ